LRVWYSDFQWKSVHPFEGWKLDAYHFCGTFIIDSNDFQRELWVHWQSLFQIHIVAMK
jgi:hypothetical protein